MQIFDNKILLTFCRIMVKFVQNQQTIRLIEVYNNLLKKGIVNKQIEFCNQVAYLETSFNAALKGRRDIPAIVINRACTAYGINPEYIFDGKKPIMKEQQSEPTPSYNENEIELLKVRVQYLEKINSLLEKQLEESKKAPIKKH